ncbi:MAG: GNAT family protein [Myxococcales bacterium]
MLRGPAYRIETERLSLRCLEPRDVYLVDEAILASLEHLRPWMSWAVHEPLTLEERLELLRARRGHFDLGGDLYYGLFDKQKKRMLGGAGLSLRSDVDEREVGYWIRPDVLRQGLATEAVAALVRVAFDIENLSCVDLRVAPHNLASAGLAEKLGFEGPVLDPMSEPTPEGDKVDMHMYSLPRLLYATSPMRGTQLEAFDALERQIL